MSWQNVVRFIGFLCMVALVVGLPVLAAKIVAIWFFQNIIAMAAMLAAEAVFGVYLMYFIIRYGLVQGGRNM